MRVCYCCLILLLLLTGLTPAQAQRRAGPSARLPRPVPKVLVRRELRVVVRTADGELAAHAQVTLSPASSRQLSPATRTDRWGVARFYQVLRGSYILWVHPDIRQERRWNYYSQSHKQTVLVLPVDTARQELQIRLQKVYEATTYRNCGQANGVFVLTNPLDSYLPDWAQQLHEAELAVAVRQAPLGGAALLAHLPRVYAPVLSPLTGDVAPRTAGLDPHLTESGFAWQRGWAGRAGSWQGPALGIGKIIVVPQQLTARWLNNGTEDIERRELTTLAGLSSLGETSAQAWGVRAARNHSANLAAGASWRPALRRGAEVAIPAVRQLLLRPSLELQTRDEKLTGWVSYALEQQHRASRYFTAASPEPYAVSSTQGRHTAAYQLGWSTPAAGTPGWWPYRLAALGVLDWFRRREVEPVGQFAGRQGTQLQVLTANWQPLRNPLAYLTLEGIRQVEAFRPLSPELAALRYTYRRRSLRGAFQWVSPQNRQRGPVLGAVGELRLEHHNVFGTFWLPRATVTLAPDKSSRFGPVQLSVSRDYHAPNAFDFFVPDNAQTSPHLLYRQPVLASTRAERLWHFTAGGRYRFSSGWLGSGTLAQELGYTVIHQPLVQRAAVLDGQYGTYLLNADYRLRGYASHTYLATRLRNTHLRAYYGFSQVRRRGQDYLPFSPRHRLWADLSRELRPGWRLQVSEQVVAGQVGYDGRPLPTYGLLGASAEYHPGKNQRTIFTLTADNLLNVRQRQYALVHTGQPDAPPAFQPLWGPQLGRVLTLSVQHTLPKKD